MYSKMRAMRRLLLILMLLIMPLQVSWAVASSYCKHETGAAANHFAHHEHRHQAQSDDSKSGKTLSAVDSDCAFCKLSSVAMSITPAHAVLTVLPEVKSPSIRIDFLAVLRPERPERPNWRRAV